MKSINRALIAILFFIGFSCHEPKVELPNKNNLKNTNQEENSNSKKKLIFYHHGYYKLGGINRWLITLLNNLDYSKYEVDVFLLTNKELDFFRTQCPENVNIITSFQEKKYDLGISLFWGVVELLFKNPFNKKKIIWMHSDTDDLAYKEDPFKFQNLIQESDKIVIVSNKSQEALLKVISNIENKSKVIYNLIDIKKVKERSLEEIAEKKHEALQLVSIGRLAPLKGFDRLIDVVNRLKNEDKLNFHLWIVGQGSEEIKLKDQIQKLGLENTIQLMGFRQNPYSYLKAADVFVLPSRHESMSYVVLEAMILNKPIVSTDVSGPGEILGATLSQGALTSIGEYGILTKNSEEGIYQGLKQMITDKSLRNSFIGKEKDFSTFETSNVVRQVEALFDEVMSK